MGEGGLTQGVGDEVQEGVPQEAPRGEAEQELEQGLVLGAVGLHRDQEEDEVGGGADQEGRPQGLRGRGGRNGGEGETRPQSRRAAPPPDPQGRKRRGETPHSGLPNLWRQPGGQFLPHRGRLRREAPAESSPAGIGPPPHTR